MTTAPDPLYLHNSQGAAFEVFAIDSIGHNALIHTDDKGLLMVSDQNATLAEDLAVDAGKLDASERGTCSTCQSFLAPAHDYFLLPAQLETALAQYAADVELRDEHRADHGKGQSFTMTLRTMRLNSRYDYSRDELIEALRDHFRPHCSPETGEYQGELAAINIGRKNHGKPEIPVEVAS